MKRKNIQFKMSLTSLVLMLLFFIVLGTKLPKFVESEKIRKDAFLICFANSGQFGNNAYIAPQAELDDGKIDALFVDMENDKSAFYKTLRERIPKLYKAI